MTLAGQWVSPYAGSNTGIVVLDVEDRGDRYHCVGSAWDSNSNLPSSLVRFVAGREPFQKLKTKVIPMLQGRILSADDMSAFRNRGVTFPDEVEITLDLQMPNLNIAWQTSIATHGSTTAVLTSTSAGKDSALEPLPKIKTWSDFKRYVSGLPSERFAFRGHESSKWRLRTSFHRSNRFDLERFLLDDVPELSKFFASLTPFRLNPSDSYDFAAFLSLAQHHGYPTPLLDWTWSPYIAAFFAYRNLGKNGPIKKSDKVRILKFRAYDWKWIPRSAGLFPYPPNVSLIDALPLANPRAIPQQAFGMVTNIDDIEAYLSKFNVVLGGNPALEVIDLPASARVEVMRDLALMGITAASLFPGLDGACEALRMKNFVLKA